MALPFKNKRTDNLGDVWCIAESQLLAFVDEWIDAHGTSAPDAVRGLWLAFELYCSLLRARSEPMKGREVWIVAHTPWGCSEQSLWRVVVERARWRGVGAA